MCIRGALTVEHVNDDGGACGLARDAAVVAAVAEGGARYQELARRAALGLLRLQRDAAPAGKRKRGLITPATGRRAFGDRLVLLLLFIIFQAMEG